VISRLPTDTFNAKEQLTVGNFSLIQNQASISGPLIPGVLRASLSGNYIRHEPYVQNIVPGQHGVGEENRGSVRGQLRWEPTNDIEAVTRIDWSEAVQYYDGYSHLLAPVPRAILANSIIGSFTKVALNTPQLELVLNRGISEEINFGFNDSFALKSITAYRTSGFSLGADTDSTELPINNTSQAESAQQFTQEFNLTAKWDRFHGVLGAFYFRDRDSGDYTILTAPPPAPLLKQSQPVSHASSWAVFGQGMYYLTSTISATVGARFTQDVKTVDADLFANIVPAFPNTVPLGPSVSLPGFPLPFIAHTSLTYNAFTPKFGLNWQAAPNVMLYASATNGFKSGGTNLSAFSLTALNYGPEKIWSYEGGVKSDWFHERLRVNMDVFRYDYNGLQVQSSLGSGLGVVINNAARATVNGFEAEITAKPVPSVLFGATLSLLDAKYDEFPNSSVTAAAAPYIRVLPCYVPPTGKNPAYCNAAGNRLYDAPETSLSLSGQYTHKMDIGSIYARAEYYWSSRVFYDPSNAKILSQAPSICRWATPQEAATGRPHLSAATSSTSTTLSRLDRMDRRRTAYLGHLQPSLCGSRSNSKTIDLRFQGNISLCPLAAITSAGT
jgi:iron complex outermembrane receptor protein